MWIFSGLLLAVSLSMDALGIGLTYGLRAVQVPMLPKLIISAISLLATSLAVGLGNVILLLLPADAAKLVGAVMLVALGVFIIYQALYKATDKKNDSTNPMDKGEKSWSMALKPLGITIKIIRDPLTGDFDGSARIDAKEATYLGVALSIDSFGAGISSAVTGVNSLFVPVMVGICQFLFLTIGVAVGSRLSSKSVNSQFFVVLSGIMLIVLAIIRYFC